MWPEDTPLVPEDDSVIVAVQKEDRPAEAEALSQMLRNMRPSADEQPLPFVAFPDAALARTLGMKNDVGVFLVDADRRIRWRREVAGMRDINRREFVASLAAAVALLAIGSTDAHAASKSDVPVTEFPATVAAPIAVVLRINGRPHELDLDPRTTLLDALREHLDMTGTKKGCDHGQCGACTVHIDGRRVLSCLTLAATAQSHDITTIEGVANGDALHPVQQAFIEHDGFQCGYCTPGQIMSAIALLHEPVGTSDADVREFMSGNICRCGAYPNIVAAVQAARASHAAAGGL